MASKTTKAKATPAKAKERKGRAADAVPCMDGCGAQPRGASARFRPGHDAALRGVVLRAVVAAEDGTAAQVAASKAERQERGLGAGPAWTAALVWMAEAHPEDGIAANGQRIAA